MKKHALHILSLGAVTSLGLAGILNSPVSFADDSMQNTTKHERPAFMEDIVRSVTPIENGIRITMTSDDAEAVTHLQEGPKGPKMKNKMEGVTENITKLSNGVQIELTSEDAAVVEKLQTKGEKMGPDHERGHGKGFWMHNDKVTKNITKTDTGITIQLSTEDAETLQELHAFEFPEEKN